MTIVTRPAWGMPAAPIEAAVAVMEIATTLPKEMEMPRTWAMKMAAMASYKAVPSMLMVAPMGRTNCEILGSILFLFSKQSMVTGNVAEDEAVPKAVVRAFIMFPMNLNGRRLNIKNHATSSGSFHLLKIRVFYYK